MAGKIKMVVLPKKWVTLNGVRYGAGAVIEVEQGTQDARLKPVNPAPAQVIVKPVTPEGGAANGTN